MRNCADAIKPPKISWAASDRFSQRGFSPLEVETVQCVCLCANQCAVMAMESRITLDQRNVFASHKKL